MNINDGLYPNANPGAVRNGVKSFALNIMYNDDGNTLINENGFEVYKKDLDVYGTLVGKIEVPLGVILFFKGTPDKIVYIYQTTKDKDDIKTIVFQGNFNFTIYHPISGTFTYIDETNLFITFTEGVSSDNETRILYITEAQSKYKGYIENPIIKDNVTTITFKEGFEYILNLIPDIVFPTLDVNIIAGGLKAGGYQFATSIKLHDGTYSDYSLLSPVYYAAPDYGENIAIGDVTKKGFRFKFSKAGTYKLAIVYKSPTTEECYETFEINIPSVNSTFDFTTISKMKSISIDDIIISNTAYTKDEAQTSFDGYLLRGNVVTPEYKDITDFFTSIDGELLLQKIKIDFVKFAEFSGVKDFVNTSITPHSESGKVGDFFKSKDISNSGSFKEDEVYYFFITFIDHKGKYINSFPIKNSRGTYAHIINASKTKTLDLYGAKVNMNTFVSAFNTNTNITKFKNSIKSYAIYYAKSTPEISNWISQCLTIRDIGTNDVIGDNYEDPFRSASRFRLYPIEYLVTNTVLPSFYIKGLRYNKEAKICLNNYEGGSGTEWGNDAIHQAWNAGDRARLNSLIQENLLNGKNLNTPDKSINAGEYLGAFDRLSKYTKKTDMPKTSKDFNMFTDWGDHIKGPWESGDLVHSILDTETTDIANNAPYPTILNADFYPINNSAISNAGCDSSFKLINGSTMLQENIFGLAKEGTDSEGGTSLPNESLTDIVYKQANEEIDGIKRDVRTQTRIISVITKDDNSDSYRQELTTIKEKLIYANGYNNAEYLKQNSEGIWEVITDEKEATIILNSEITVKTLTAEEYNSIIIEVSNKDDSNWILLYNENKKYYNFDTFTIFNRGIVDLNRYYDVNTIPVPDLFNLSLVAASSIYPIENTDEIILIGDTFPACVTQRCTCPSNKFNNVGDATHHNNNIYHIHRMIVTYYIKSRMNFLALHSGKNVNSSIIKYKGTTANNNFSGKANKFNINTIINKFTSGLSEEYAPHTMDIYSTTFDYDSIIDLGYRDYVIDNFWHTEDGSAYDVEMNWKGFNDITQFKSTDNLKDTFAARIIRSNVNNMESNDIGWRKFKADSYKDIPITKGSIVNLLSDAKSLYIQMEHTLFVTSVKDSLNQEEDGTYIGTSDIFERTPIEIIFNNTGKIGCNNKFSSIITRYGYFVCDNFTGTIYHVKGESDVSDISSIGLQGWFKEYIKENAINPLNTNGNFFIFDDYNSRIIFVSNNPDNTYTISYNLKTNLWISFHSYNPIITWSNRLGTFVVDTNNTKIYKINAPNKCIYFDNKIMPSIAQFIYNEEPLVSKLFNHIEWNSALVHNWNHLTADKIKFLYDKTIDYLMINTDTQSTGILPMILDETWYDDHTLKYKAGRYLWNLIEDHIDNDRAFQILNPSNIPFEIDRLLGMKYEPKAWYEYSKIQNQFGYITMVYLNRFIDTTTNEDINETDVNTIIDKHSDNIDITSKDSNIKQAELRLYDINVVVTKNTRL